MTARRIISQLGRGVAGLMLTAAIVMASAGDAWAQRGKEPEAAEPETRGLTMPYFIVGVALLMIVTPVCWPALRRWDLPFHGEEV